MNYSNQPYNKPDRDRHSGQQRQNQGSGKNDRLENPFKREEDKDKINKWISDKLNQESITKAEEFGKYLALSGFSTNQIRNFFGEVRRIQQKGILKDDTSFLLLKPKLAYAAKRAGGVAKDFREVMEMAHTSVMESKDDKSEFQKRFKNYVDFLEAILAYHKANEKK